MSTEDVFQCCSLAALLVLSGFFSSAETAMTTVNRIRIRTMADQGDVRAARLLKILSDTPKMLSAILIGNNIVNISASSLATALTLRHFGNGAIAFSTGLMTLLVLIFGEITPKTMAAAGAERLSLSYSGIIRLLMTVMTPLIAAVDALSGLVIRLLRVERKNEEEPITEQELRTMLEIGHEGGTIESEERRMINNVFDFGDDLAREVMVPAPDMVTVEITDSYDEIAKVFRREKFTRLPVCRGGRDHIAGILNIKDFLFVEDKEHFSPEDIIYEPYFTYEQKKISELLLEMRRNAISLTIVLDEYGAVAGLITLEDLLEELVGDIRDEYDDDEKNLIRPLGNGEYLVEGAVKLDDINDALGLKLHSEDYDSVGGYIIEALDHLPTAGEVVVTDEGDLLKVEKMHRKRIQLVRLYVRHVPDPV